MPLRYYQEDACDSVRCALEFYDRVLITLGTGAGKTVVAADLIRSFLPHRCLFLADQDELCTQPMTAISRFANVIPGLEKAKYKASLNTKVIVASAQTLARESRLYRFPYHFFKYGIIDEAHRGAKRDRKITEHLCEKIIGLTATPFLGDLRDLSEFYEDTAYKMPMMDLEGHAQGLIEQGFAPEIQILTLPIEIDLGATEVKKAFGESDYTAESISTTIEPYYRRAAELIKEHASDRKGIIVYLPLIKSSQAFAAIARQVGIAAVHVDGNDPERDEKILSFAQGRVQMICNSDLLSTGVDIPAADCMVNLSPCRSKVKYQQRVGRILRVLPGVIDDLPGRHQIEARRAAIAASVKPNALIIDFLWQHDKLGVMRPGDLIARNEQEALGIAEKIKAQRTPEQLAEIARMVQEEREALLVKQLEKVAGRIGSMQPAMFGYLIGSQELMEYEPVQRWEGEKPSERQLSRLAEWGINPAQVTCKGQASKLIGTMIFRNQFKLASPEKLEVLTKAGVKFDPRKLTDKDALRMITEYKLQVIHEKKAA